MFEAGNSYQIQLIVIVSRRHPPRDSFPVSRHL
jgi:hypothetical protein